MKDKTLKNIRLCCYIAIAFCVVWAAITITNLISNFGNNASSQPIDWSKNTFKKVVFVVCYMVGTVATIALCVKIVINTMKGLHENNVFPRSNEKLMFWIAMAVFVRLLGTANFATLWDDNFGLAVVPENLIMPFFLLFFAFMYKVAADAVEENNLTI